MIGEKDFKDFILPNTSPQNLNWSYFEEIYPNLSDLVLFLIILLFSLEDRFGGNCATTQYSTMSLKNRETIEG